MTSVEFGPTSILDSKKASILFYDFACWPKDELSEVLKCETPAKGEVDFNRAVKWACSLEPICQSNYNFWDYYNFFGISLGKFFFIHIFTSLLPALVLLCVFMKSKEEVYSASSNSRDIQISINHNWFHSHSTSLSLTRLSQHSDRLSLLCLDDVHQVQSSMLTGFRWMRDFSDSSPVIFAATVRVLFRFFFDNSTGQF